MFIRPVRFGWNTRSASFVAYSGQIFFSFVGEGTRFETRKKCTYDDRSTASSRLDHARFGGRGCYSDLNRHVDI